MNQHKWVVFRSIWFWWFLTTATYLLLNIAGYPGETPTLMGYVSGFVGLFVPYGALSVFIFMYPATMLYACISVVVFIASLIYIEKKYGKMNYSFTKKVLINLLGLLILTTIVDFIRQTPLEGWKIFFNGSFNIHF